jgi:intracellular septation protein A
MSYEGHQEDRDKVLGALGGTRGLLDSGLPSILFLVAFNVTHNLNKSALVAIALSVILAVLRLVKRETLQHAVSGVIGVAFCALLARHTGKAADFYLPGLIINVVYGLIYTVTNVVGWPLLGVLLGPILGENFAWRSVATRKSAYVRAGWLWVALFGSRLLVQYPLYKTNHLNWLGTARLAMGYPLFVLVGWGTWLILRKVPTVKPELTAE